MLLGATGPAGPAEIATIENIALRSGLNFRQNNFATAAKYPFETMGGAVAALDFDNDGYLDLFFLNGAPSPSHLRTEPDSYNRLYKNNGPGLTFTDVTECSGLSGKGIPGYPQGVAVGDYDNDGFVDVYVTNFGDNVLYHNEGNGTFTDVTARAGVAMSGHPFKASACWIDADNDGYLDLFVTHYFEWTFRGHSDYYCGDRKPGYRSYCRPEVFAALPNVLYHNNGDGTFRDISRESGIAKYAGKGMGVAVADYDDDGWMDIFVAGSHVLDNSELYNARTPYKEPCILYRNLANGKFADISENLGPDFGVPGAYRGLAVGDFDNDGSLEAAVSRLNDRCAFFKTKNPASGNWLLLVLRGVQSNRDGIGARIEATLPSGMKLYEHVSTANGIYSASDKRVHLGLGREASIETLQISWPSGVVQKLEKVKANQVMRIEEPAKP